MAQQPAQTGNVFGKLVTVFRLLLGFNALHVINKLGSEFLYTVRHGAAASAATAHELQTGVQYGAAYAAVGAGSQIVKYVTAALPAAAQKLIG